MRYVRIILLMSVSLLFSALTQGNNLSILSTDSVPPPPSESASLTGPQDICQTSYAQYAMDFPMSCSIQWYVDDILQGSDSSTLVVYWEEAGSYLIKACCNTISNVLDTLAVNVLPLPVVDLGNDTTLNEGETILLDAGNPGASYLWSTNDTTQTILVDETGLYWVTVTNECGDGYDEIYVDILTSVAKKHSITPSFSLYNNRLSISGINQIKQINIYSSSGKLIYTGNNNNIHIDGGQVVIIKIKTPYSSKAFKVYIP